MTYMDRRISEMEAARSGLTEARTALEADFEVAWRKLQPKLGDWPRLMNRTFHEYELTRSPRELKQAELSLYGLVVDVIGLRDQIRRLFEAHVEAKLKSGEWTIKIEA